MRLFATTGECSEPKARLELKTYPSNTTGKVVLFFATAVWGLGVGECSEPKARVELKTYPSNTTGKVVLFFATAV